MRYRWGTWILRSVAFLALFAAIGNCQAPARAPSQIPRVPDGKPNFTGLWQMK
jgi:hypothetical protein